MRAGRAGVLLLGLAAYVALPAAAAEPAVARYRVEQVFRLETISVTQKPPPGRLRPEPTMTAVEGRVRLVLEQSGEPGTAPASGRWRFTQVETDGPRTEPPERTDPGVERALRLALDWMKKLDGQEFQGAVTDLPVLPLGESAPLWLTTWLRWAQTGVFSGVEGSPLPLPETGRYSLQWLRSDFRRVPCSVQQAGWTVPVAAAAESVSPALAAEGVEARTLFSARSLEWVSQENPTLMYAERSGMRETFWDMEKVQRPELRELVFRLRLAVEVRVERLP